MLGWETTWFLPHWTPTGGSFCCHDPCLVNMNFLDKRHSKENEITRQQSFGPTISFPVTFYSDEIKQKKLDHKLYLCYVDT